MRRLGALALALAVALGPGLAAAEAVAVVAGTHPAFTRLVLPLPEGAAWSLAPRPGGVALILPEGTAFDLGAAFDRIGRDRVGALAPDGDGRLAIDLACTCHAKGFVTTDAEGRPWVAVDVVDGPMPEGATDAVQPGPEAPVMARPEAVPTAPPRTGAGVIPLLAGALPGAPVPFPRPAAADPARLPSPAEAARIAETEQAILLGLADAASQGFLDLVPGGLPGGAAAPVEAAEPAPPPEPVLAEARPGVAFRDAAGGPRPRLARDGADCLPPATFDLAAWAPSGDFATEIGPRSAALTDGRDRLDADGVEALARAYLAFGFGREAAATLTLDGRRSQGRDLLAALARLVDGERAPEGTLDDQGGCAGPQALWRALARDSVAGTDEAERIAIETALKALPEALRGPLAVRVAALFVATGEPLTAEALLATAASAPASPLPAPEAAVVEAEVRGATMGAEARLDGLAVAAQDPRQDAKVLAELVDASIAEGRAIAPSTLDLIAARRFELRGTPEGASLRRAEARGLARSGRIDEALALIEEGEGDLAAEVREALMAEALREATTTLDDAAFLELVLDRLPPGLTEAALAPVADRLAALGFPQEADRLRVFAAPDAAPVAGRGDDPPPEAPTSLTDAVPPPDPAAPDDARLAEAALAPAVPLLDPSFAPVAGAAPRDITSGPTLAGGRALLDDAAAARDRALALLAVAPPPP